LLRIGLFRVRLANLDFVLPRVRFLTCIWADCVDALDRPTPSITAFPALEALVYGGGIEPPAELDESMLEQLVTLTDSAYVPTPKSCFFLRQVRLPDLDQPGRFTDAVTTSQHVRFWATLWFLSICSSAMFSQLTVTLNSLDSSSLQLSRLYLPIILHPGAPECAHLSPGLDSFLDACMKRNVTIVREDMDSAFGGQRVSRDFLDYAKEQKKKTAAAEKTQKEEKSAA
jgi:hypothetical protein